MGELDGKVAIVTGGGGGIGSAVCRLLASRGASVVVADLLPAAASAVADSITAAGGTAMAAGLDVSSEGEVQALIATVTERFGGVDILHNNAALTDTHPDDVPLTHLDMTYWDKAMSVNVKGYALMAKYSLPSMVARGGGAIVNTASGAGLQGDLVRTAYGTSKAAIIGLTKYIASQFGRHNVRCVGVAPGLIATPAVAAALTPEMAAMIGSHHLLPRIGQPQDIAELVAFLVSDRGSFITGNTIECDGGFTAHAPTYSNMVQFFDNTEVHQ